MNKITYVIICSLIPFIGTSIGSGFVFFVSNKFSKKLNNFLIGFAIGVMIASSFFSLIIPSLELSSNYKCVWIPPSIGFALGFIFLILTRKYTNNKDMLTFSVTLHNIPEGMAVGVILASFLVGASSFLSSFVLSLGIALQNIPEGSIISVPYRIKGNSKLKSFNIGVLSGVVEPLFSFITMILINIVLPLLPYFLSFASGAMIYVVIRELSNELGEEKSNRGIIGVMIGFIIMMILDVALS